MNINSYWYRASVEGHEKECRCGECLGQQWAKLRDRWIEGLISRGEVMKRLGIEPSSSDDSIEPLKAAIRELSEKQQQVVYCWMHEELNCRRFKD